MKFEKIENGLKLVIDSDGERKSLQDFKDEGLLETDMAMYDFFDNILANCEWEWIRPEEIAALTDAPILGIVKELDDHGNREVLEAYGFMDYQVRSLLEDLHEYGEAILQKG